MAASSRQHLVISYSSRLIWGRVGMGAQTVGHNVPYAAGSWEASAVADLFVPLASSHMKDLKAAPSLSSKYAAASTGRSADTVTRMPGGGFHGAMQCQVG